MKKQSMELWAGKRTGGPAQHQGPAAQRKLGPGPLRISTFACWSGLISQLPILIAFSSSLPISEYRFFFLPCSGKKKPFYFFLDMVAAGMRTWRERISPTPHSDSPVCLSLRVGRLRRSGLGEAGNPNCAAPAAPHPNLIGCGLRLEARGICTKCPGDPLEMLHRQRETSGSQSGEAEKNSEGPKRASDSRGIERVHVA